MFENFAMMIPKHAIYKIDNCLLFGATGEEFTRFSEWVDSNIVQLQAKDILLDLWISKDFYSLGVRDIKTLNEWFAHWKNPPEQNYGFTETKITK